MIKVGSEQMFCEKNAKIFIRISQTFSQNFAFFAKMKKAKNSKMQRNFAKKNLQNFAKRFFFSLQTLNSKLILKRF